MLIREITDVIERFAPLAWQESYDNAGLIVGRPDDEVRKALEAQGVTCEEFAFTDSNDVSSVTQKAADFSDVVYIPTDNTAASNTEAIANVLIPAGVPAICGEEGLCRGCGVATV